MKTRTVSALICGAITALLVVSAAEAQNVLDLVQKAVAAIQPPTTESKTREATLDLSVPKSPAFTALGVTPESVIRPASPRALGLSLLNGGDPKGNLQAGLAVETAPYLLWAGNNLTLRRYQDNYLERLMSRIQLSLATAKGLNDDDKATRAALGLFITLFDLGDPRNDPVLISCFREKIGPIHKKAVAVMDEIAPIVATRPEAEVTAAIEERIAPLQEAAKKQAEACRAEARKRHWNASAWNIGVAPTWTANKGQVSELHSSGTSVWTTLGYGFESISGLEDVAQILLHARYRGNEVVAAPEGNGAFLKQDTLTLAGQLRIAGLTFREPKGDPDLSLLLEAAYIRENRHNRPNERLFRYSVGFDFRLTNDLYLDVSIGTEDGRKAGKDAQFGMAGLKWGFLNQPRQNAK